eukprot:369112_1
MSSNVLFYVPNIICYVRLLIQIYGLKFLVNEPTTFLWYTFISCCFDFFDGIAARKLNQTSKFGAILDVLLDNFSRSALWIGLLIHTKNPPLWVIFSCIYCPMEEWFTFLCMQLMTAESNSKHWKAVNEKSTDPFWCRVVFKNGFKNIYGFFVLGSSWSLPFWAIAYNIGYQNWLIWFIIVISIPSRLYNTAICLYVQKKYMLNVD